MGHLRWAFGDRLPEWTGRIAPRSGVLSGEMAVTVAGLSTASLAWRFYNIAGDGIAFHATLVGEGLNLSAKIKRPFWQNDLTASELRGDIDLANIPLNFYDRSLAGTINIENGSVTFDVEDQIWTAPSGIVTVLEASLDRQILGNGSIEVSPGEGREWLADIAVLGGAMNAEISARGATDQPMATLVGEIRRGAGFPDNLDRALSQAYPRNSTGWRVDQEIDVREFVSVR